MLQGALKKLPGIWATLRKAHAPQTTVILLGGPGSGKSLIAKQLASAFEANHVSVGELVRAAVGECEEKTISTDSATSLGSDVRRGRLLPDSYVTTLLEDRLAAGRRLGEKGVVLDGFPRTLKQAHALLESHPVQVAVHLRARDEVLFTRCMGRQVCSECGRSYAEQCPSNTPQGPPSPQPRAASIPSGASAAMGLSSCTGLTGTSLVAPPACLGKLRRRGDDQASSVQHRIEVYRRETTAIDEVFREAGLLVDVDVGGSVAEGRTRLLTALRSRCPPGVLKC